jgi:tetratricopeptide (TPR) repeat protein
VVLRERKDLAGAEQAHRQAIRLDPSLALAHTNLGNVLRARKDLAGAEKAYREAIRLDPTNATAHNNLGHVLRARKDLAGAEKAYREAIRLDPNLARAHGALGLTLLEQGRFAEAKAATRRCLDLLPPNHPLRQPVTQQLQRSERLLALDGKLTAAPRGAAKPADAAEGLALAHLCLHYKQRYGAAARFYAAAFAARPALADDPRAGHRYNAACAAALAAAGQGQDTAGLSDEGRSGLRRQALTWLRADLRAWDRLAGGTAPQASAAAARALAHWRRDADLAGLRDEAVLAKLPEAERQAWRKLWADVAALLQRAQAKE